MAKHFEWKHISQGISETSLNSWEEFHDLVNQKTLRRTNLLYRGQTCSNWELKSFISRLRENWQESTFKSFCDKQLKQFKMASRGRCQLTEREKEDKWWAYAQHIGLATPLLDWTTSPYIALFFAFCANVDEYTQSPGDPRVVYILDQRKIKIKNKEIKEKYDATELIHFIEPFSHDNHRLVNQAGLFTKSPYNYEIEEWINFELENDSDEFVIRKILIPGNDRNDCLKALNRMNINYLTLFSDIEGAAKHCNLSREIRSYSS